MFLRILLFSIFIALCSCGKNDGADGSEIITESMRMPSLDGSSKSISGEITFWMLEGDAGCYGEIKVGNSLYELWSEADLCENEDVEEGSVQTVVLRLESDKQSYLAVAGKPVYSIIEFK